MNFFPSVDYITGSLELDMVQRDYKTTTVNTSSETSLRSFTEKIRIDTYGYVYHPRFMVFQLGGSAGLIQDSTTNTGLASGKNHGFNEYDADIMLLPEHRYNLELFTRKQMGAPMAFSPESTVNSSEGAIFRYKQRPFLLHLSALDSSYERGSAWSDAKQYDAAGTYFLGPTTNTLSYQLIDTTTSQGETAFSTYSYFNNTFKLSSVTLKSQVSAMRQAQDSFADMPAIGVDRSEWYERLDAQLPLNVSLYAEHNYRKQENTSVQSLPASPESTVFEKDSLDFLTLQHQLYNSLRTAYNASEKKNRSTAGDQSSTTQGLSFNYTKNIPGGIFNAGCGFQDTVMTRTGAANILNEAHAQVLVPGVFLLYNQAVDPSTITVMVKDPNPPQNLISLTLNVNYTIQQFGNAVQITVLNLPPAINPPTLNNLYDFVVSYALARNDSQTDTKDKTINFSFSLFDGLFGPYYSYSTSDLKVISGTYPGGDTYSKNVTYGYSVKRKPFLFVLERTDYQSPTSPYRSIRASTDYQQLLTPDTDITARLTYNKTEHFATYISSGSLDKTTSMEISAHKVFPYDNLELFGGGIYTVNEVTGMTTDNYTLSASLKWHVGKLDVYASGSKTYSVSVATSGNQSSKQLSEQDSYYLVVSRKIF
jgi:hypothetical protein